MKKLKIKIPIHYSLPLIEDNKINGIFGIGLSENLNIDLYSNFDIDDKQPKIEIYFNNKGYINFFSFTDFRDEFISISYN